MNRPMLNRIVVTNLQLVALLEEVMPLTKYDDLCQWKWKVAARLEELRNEDKYTFDSKGGRMPCQVS